MTTVITTEACDTCRSDIHAGGVCVSCGVPTPMRRLAEKLMANGQSDDSVTSELVRAGYSDTRAAWVINEIHVRQNPRLVGIGGPAEEENKLSGGAQALIGVGMIAGGVIATAVSYSSAARGGTYTVWWGLILVGVITLIRGLASSD